MWLASLFLASNALAQVPTGLAVKSATSTQVQLTWTGTANSYTVQRAPVGGAFISIATVGATSYTDSQIDPYLDYTYQIVTGTSGASASNEVTTGPPPAGLSVAAPAPVFGNSPGGGYGYNISLALDGNGDPAFAFVWEDPGNQADYTLAQLLFRSWNRAQATWNPVVKIATVGDITNSGRAATSLAWDASTKTFAVATENKDGAVELYASTDSGATWRLRNSYQPGLATGPSLALAGGNLYLAFMVSGEGLEYVTGKLSADPATWQTRLAPQLSGMETAVTSYSPSLALDGAGNPAIAYYTTRLTGSQTNVLLFWRPGTQPSIAFSTKDSTGDTDQVRMVFHNLNPRLALGLSVIPIPNVPDTVGVYFLRSDDGGATWKAPVAPPPDGNAGTEYPFDIASDSKDGAAIAWGTDGVIGSMACGNPKLSRSSDLVNWTTCSAPSAENFTLYPSSIQLAAGGNDKLYLLWFNEGGTSQADTGVFMYREPPPNQIFGPVISSVQDAESARATVVPGSWVAIYGANLAATTRAWTIEDFTDDNLPMSLSGVSVTFNGLPAAIYFVSPGQIDLQVPSNISGIVSVVVTSNNAVSAAFNATVAANAPSLFFYPVGGTFYPAAVLPDSTLVGDPAVAGVRCAKVRPGDTVLFFVNGISSSPSGKTISAPIPYAGVVKVAIGTVTTVPAYTGLVAAGQYQMNVVIPAGLAPGDYPIVVTVAGQSSPANVMLPVTH
jgi:uncharacterized protein (TIGR03437 family)